MKKIILSLGVVLLFANISFAQKGPTSKSLDDWLNRIYAEEDAKRLKSYYINRETAEICEQWNSCAKWAFEEYKKDQSFKIVKAEFKTQRRVRRHHITTETHLFIEAIYKYRTVRLEFTTPKASGRNRPYNYIAQSPKNPPVGVSFFPL